MASFTQHLNNTITNLNWETFRSLSADEKRDCVMRLLPAITSFERNFNEVRDEIDASLDKLERTNLIKRFPTDGSLKSQSIASCSSDEHSIPDPHIILKTKKVNKRVCLNVGGVRHEVMWRMLENIPNSRLGRLVTAGSHQEILRLCSDYSLLDNEYFFDRHPRSFNSILNFYRTGKLHIQDDMCMLAFSDDLQYWGINELNLEFCCQFKYEKMKEAVLEEMEIEAGKLRQDDEDDFGDGKFSKYQQCLWELMEKPHTSVSAKGVSFLSFIFVLVSTVGMTLNTMPSVQHTDEQGNVVENPKLAMVESTCIFWFTLEYILRFAGAPEKVQFVVNGMNIVDLLAILPYYATLFFNPVTVTISPDESGRLDDVLQIFRIFKLARILKLARHSTGLQSIAFTLKNSYKELGLLLLFISIAGLLFSSLCYFIEGEEADTQYTSIPSAFYWVVITMTTVGYGDIYPTTGAGKLIGTFCAISGVLVMSLPIPIITSNFEKFYKEQNKKEKAAKRKNRLRLAKKREEMRQEGRG